MAKIKMNRDFIYRGPSSMSEEQATEIAAWKLFNEYKKQQKAKNTAFKPDLSKKKIEKVKVEKTCTEICAAVIAYAPKVIDLTVEEVKQAFLAIEEDNKDKIVNVRFDEAHRGALRVTVTFKTLREIKDYDLSKGTRPGDPNYTEVLF